MRKCLKEDCNSPVFSNGYCKVHHYLRSDDKYKKSLDKPKRVYEKKKYHKHYPVEDDNSPFERILEAVTDDLQQDNTIYQKEKIVSPTVQNKIRKQSKKHIGKSRKIQEIKRQLMKDFGYCFFGGYTTGTLDAFHIFPQGKYPEYATEPWNIILSIRHYNRIWDQGTWEEIQKIPNVHWLFKIIQDKDNDPYKKHSGSFYEQLKNRKDKI